MAKALTRLLDLPGGLSSDFKSAAEDLQDKRLKQFFNDDGLVMDFKGLFKNQKFKDWVEADEQMWESSNKKGWAAELATAKAAIDSQAKYHALQSSLGFTVGGQYYFA